MEEWVTGPFPEDITELLVDMREEEFEAGVAEAEDEADFQMMMKISRLRYF